MTCRYGVLISKTDIQEKIEHPIAALTTRLVFTICSNKLATKDSVRNDLNFVVVQDFSDND